MSKMNTFLKWTSRIGLAAAKATPFGGVATEVESLVLNRKPSTPLGVPIIDDTPDTPREVAVSMVLNNLPAVLGLIPIAGEGVRVSDVLTLATNEFEIYVRRETEDQIEHDIRTGAPK